ncbi:helix-turn-helix transcriptional regulator [Natrinema sp. H-ect1]|uniref:helix-turn-helix transcriptional regulator n=1 Tax=Natrinema sp. H-ect1 TaxID=3242700 RepID=UPI00359D2BC8
MNGRAAVTVAVVALLLVAAGPSAATGTVATGGAQSEPFTLQQDGIDADEVRMDVALRADGSADWTLEFWIRLDDNESEAAFESLRDDIREEPANHTARFAERMNGTVATASNATGREMAAADFAVETERQSFAREYGVVRYTFRWDGFAAVDGDRLRAGDAVAGLYLDDGTRLLIEWPEGYERTSVAPDPDDERERAVIWRGDDTDFVDDEPEVVVTAAGGATGSSPLLIAGGVVVLLGLGAAGAWWYRNREPTADRPGGDGTPAAGSGGGSASGTDTESPSGSAAETASAADSSPAGTSDPASDADAAGAAAGVDTELLSNEEQVLRLVKERGGRMKQQAVVEELDWTDAKTSKVVSGLREDGKLESFRLGRENVLSLPEVDDGIVPDSADEDE